MNNKIQAVLMMTLGSGLLTSAAPLAIAAASVSNGAPRWEVTFAVNGNQSADGSRIALPQAEAEYLWRERIKLTSKLSWPVLRTVGEPIRSGVGMGEMGLKLLIWEGAESKFSMELCPQLARYVKSSSVRREIVSTEREFALPLETKFVASGVEFELIGPDFYRQPAR